MDFYHLALIVIFILVFRFTTKNHDNQINYLISRWALEIAELDPEKRNKRLFELKGYAEYPDAKGPLEIGNQEVLRKVIKFAREIIADRENEES